MKPLIFIGCSIIVLGMSKFFLIKKIETEETRYQAGFYIRVDDFIDEAPAISKVILLAAKMHKGVMFSRAHIYYTRSTVDLTEFSKVNARITIDGLNITAKGKKNFAAITVQAPTIITEENEMPVRVVKK